MTTVRTVAVHEIVRRTYPRPPPEDRDLVAMAVGKAIDGALTEFGHALRRGWRPTAAAIGREGERLLDEALADAAVTVAPAERDALGRRIAAVVAAYRRSPLVGLARPKSRILLIGDEVAVYAQPDYWDGRSRFYELKSYRAIPPPPDVALQLRLFQLAFPRFEAVIVCLNRHADPVEVVSAVVPPPTEPETADALRRAYDVGLEFGEVKVREYLEGPFVAYRRPPADAPGHGPAPEPSSPRDASPGAGIG